MSEAAEENNAVAILEAWRLIGSNVDVAYDRQATLVDVDKAGSALDAAQAIQINMQHTDFIDSSIIRLILKFHDTARKNKKSLVITNCSERIYEIFTIGGFDQVVDIQ